MSMHVITTSFLFMIKGSFSLNFGFRFRRPYHYSVIYRHGLYPFYNRHKQLTDPNRQEEDYFENEAEKLPLNNRYIDELKKLWKEKIGNERELIFKAQDRLVGKSDFGLPQLDMSSPRLEYRALDALTNAPESVKKIFSLKHGESRDRAAVWKLEMMKKVRRDQMDNKSLPAAIAWATATIRNWSKQYAEYDNKRKKLIYGKMRRRATWISHPLYLLINHRRKLLRLLRDTNKEEFHKVINQLKIVYHIEKDPEHIKTRKAWSEAQLKRRVALEKERQLMILHKKLMENREEKTKQIDNELKQLIQEEKQIQEKLHWMDIQLKKTVANVTGKYVPNYIEELREIADNGRIFFN